VLLASVHDLSNGPVPKEEVHMLWESTYLEINTSPRDDIIVNGTPPGSPSPIGGIDPAVLAALTGGSFGAYLQSLALALSAAVAPSDGSGSDPNSEDSFEWLDDAIIVDGMILTSVDQNPNYNSLSPDQMRNILNSWRDEWVNQNLSLGISYWIAAGGTFYTDGVGIFLGIARPGLVLSGGTAAEGDEEGWDAGPDSVLYQSGPLPVAGSVAVFYDPVRNEYYTAGDVWDSELEVYVSPPPPGD
jgi:hypothetical protein